MPYPYYTKMTRDDVLAIRAYLNTVDAGPQRGRRPTSCRSRSTSAPRMAAWDALYFTNGEFKPDPTKSADWNRGAYLVEGPGHCGACHTPKTSLGGDETRARSPGLRAPGLVRARHHQRRATGPRRLERRRHRRLSEDRPQPLRRRDRTDGRGSGAVEFADDRRRPHRDRDLSEGPARPDSGAAAPFPPPIRR